MKNDEGNGRTRRAGTRTALRRLLRHDLRQRRHRARRVDRKRGGDAIPRPRRRSVGSAPAPRGTCLHVPTQRRGRDPNMQKCCGQLVGVEHFVSKGGEGENERENAIRSRVVDHWPPVAFPIDRSRRSGLKGSFFGHGRARVSANARVMRSTTRATRFGGGRAGAPRPLSASALSSTIARHPRARRWPRPPPRRSRR